MSSHRYPRSISRNDYMRAAAGLIVCVPLAIVTRDTTVGLWIFVILSLLFLVFGVRTWLRAGTEYRLTDDGLVRTNTALSAKLPTEMSWQSLTSLTLRFYPLRRDRSEGWMQLTIRASGVRFSIDSTLENFESLATAALTAGLRNELAMTHATLANFEALGISPDCAAAAAKPDSGS